MILGIASSCTTPRPGTQSPLLDAAQQKPAHEISAMDPLKLAPNPQRQPAQELGALHLLYDLLDQARFAQDAQARDLLWTVLAGGEQRRGTQAFRQAASEILARAWDLETRVEELSPKDPQWSPELQESLSQLITLLSMDVNASAQDEQVRDLALGLRTLQPQARPEVSDNLNWRIYDFDRALVEAIIDAPPGERAELLRYAGLMTPSAEDEDPDFLPTLDYWIAPWHNARKALRQDPRWASCIQARDPQDQASVDRLTLITPVQRRSDWDLPRIDARPQGESWIPDPMGSLFLLRDEGLSADGQAMAHHDPEPLQRALAQHLAVVGRNHATLAVDRMTPAPLLHKSLAAMNRAGVQSLLVAGYPSEALTPPKGQHARLEGVLVKLSDSLAPQELYIAAFSSGYRLGWKEAMLPELLPDLEAVGMWVSRYAFAYPTRTKIQVAYAQDLSYEQRLALLLRLHLALGPHTEIEWVARDENAPSLWPESPALAATLLTRARWRWPRGQEAPVVELKTIAGQEPSTTDVASAHALATSMQQCLVGLERTKLRKAQLFAKLNFSNGSLASWEWSGSAANRIDAKATARVNQCVQSLATSLRLPHARAPWQVQVRWTLPKQALG